ncbi:hypothetical protein ENSA5_55710 [Enhygromyxa salina]|uniref:Tetratricopeptide repeat protein n=1 Tax=Enhygromyxa salina TaxID=215803 RepID=A0A2S9XF10_9BACT|nr:hypothetical protein [Enhygromyxa salina]PRP91454.1 hypothetical protein ENSA5_55710 [Enhygromyxa salina]
MNESDTFELKKIHHGSIAHALGKARKYRDLNDPRQAESICLDILAVEPDNEDARLELILAMSDQYAGIRKSPRTAAIMKHVDKLGDEYSRLYYRGLVTEREALGFLDRGHAAAFAYDGLRDAMDLYEAAEKLRPEGNEDAVLRWNACVRVIRREKLKPPPQYKQELPID